MGYHFAARFCPVSIASDPLGENQDRWEPFVSTPGRLTASPLFQLFHWLVPRWVEFHSSSPLP